MARDDVNFHANLDALKKFNLLYNLVLNSKFTSEAETPSENQYSVVAKLLKITLRIIYGEFDYLKMYQELH